MEPFFAGFADELVKIGALTDGLNSGEGAGAVMGTGRGMRRRRRRMRKRAASRKDPTAGTQTKMEKLLKGGLKKYLGSPEIRHPTFPPMAEVANRQFKDHGPKLNLRPPKPPK